MAFHNDFGRNVYMVKSFKIEVHFKIMQVVIENYYMHSVLFEIKKCQTTYYDYQNGWSGNTKVK